MFPMISPLAISYAPRTINRMTSRRCAIVTLLFAQSMFAADETFVLLDGRTGKTTVENPQRARQRFTPCSTYKVPNSLIALETGEAADPTFTLAYDPKRDGEQRGAWALDLDLRSALRYSALWYYRERARRVGPARMEKYLA